MMSPLDSASRHGAVGAVVVGVGIGTGIGTGVGTGVGVGTGTGVGVGTGVVDGGGLRVNRFRARIRCFMVCKSVLVVGDVCKETFEIPTFSRFLYCTELLTFVFTILLLHVSYSPAFLLTGPPFHSLCPMPANFRNDVHCFNSAVLALVVEASWLLLQLNSIVGYLWHNHPRFQRHHLQVLLSVSKRK
mgnify:CR=1 FL=1